MHKIFSIASFASVDSALYASLVTRSTKGRNFSRGAWISTHTENRVKSQDGTTHVLSAEETKKPPFESRLSQLWPESMIGTLVSILVHDVASAKFHHLLNGERRFFTSL